MTTLGKTKYKAVGYRNRMALFIWAACEKCGKKRWVRAIYGKARSRYCTKCGFKDHERCLALSKASSEKVGDKSASWKGGRLKATDGYIRRWIGTDDPYYPMASKMGYVMEHRLIMAQSLGRCLLRSEYVHHKNGIHDDNRIENLQLMPDAVSHNKMIVCSNCSLRKEIRLLRWQIKQLNEALQLKMGSISPGAG